ncbi:MAG: peptidoglycan DD-metalloendopeptidase family protein [Spiribacter sp.]|jgi:septal ring factor EnvC (AmiA/AmiB activator)|nr:peptidoglycan DD-metalloendopeptidase family protein [Spiribacter sp.]MDR9489361.1 peptidoglycan DD-metalloendopeptidase family protein [Spiribacter sp.]
MRRFILIVGLLLSLPVSADDASDLAEREARLEALRERVATLGEMLAEQRERAGGLEAELARLEQRMGNERAALTGLDEKIQATSKAVAQRQQAVAEQAQQAEAHQDFLAATVRSAYRRGQADTLKLLLGDFDPAQLQRLLVYRQRLGQARAEQITQAQEAVRGLKNEQAALEQALSEQRQVRRQREKALAALQSSLAEREDLLAEVEDQIDNDSARLAREKAEAESLSSLIKSLRERLDATASSRVTTDLPSARGALSWPLQGPLLARYGSERAAGLNWTGLLIGGEAGTPVYPVAAGQVVFADWLRGLGLLLIIDHGDGYLSLYGRNQALYFNVGDRVRRDDVIATVGRSGGRPETALYFELRADGKPVDPLSWLSAGGHQG